MYSVISDQRPMYRSLPFVAVWLFAYRSELTIVVDVGGRNNHFRVAVGHAPGSKTGPRRASS